MTKTQKGLLAGLIIAICIIGAGAGAWHYRDAMPAMLSTGPQISKEAQAHILHGDKSGGGHMFGTGKPCKTEFPKDWNEAEIIGTIRKVAANDNLKWKKQRNGYYTATDKIDDVKVRVVLDKERDDIVTAYPVNVKANACKARPARSARKAQPSQAPEAVETSSGTPNAASRAPKSYNFNTREQN